MSLLSGFRPRTFAVFINAVCSSMQYVGGFFNILSEHYRIHSGVGCISDGISPLYHGNGCIYRLFTQSGLHGEWRAFAFIYGSNMMNIEHLRTGSHAPPASVHKCADRVESHLYRTTSQSLTCQHQTHRKIPWRNHSTLSR